MKLHEKYLVTEAKKLGDYHYNYMPDSPEKDGKKVISSALKFIQKNFVIQSDRVNTSGDGSTGVTFVYKQDRTVLKMLKPKESMATMTWGESAYSKKGAIEWLIHLHFGMSGHRGYEIASNKSLSEVLKDNGVPTK